MMRLARFKLVGFVFAFSAGSALGDLSPTASSSTGEAAFQLAVYDGATKTAHRGTAALELWTGSVTGAHARLMARAQTTGDSVIRELREPPSSMSLYLSVLIGVGGWHFVRSARHFNMSAAPEWYHTGGPIQVGHSTPLDPSFGTPPLCHFEQPVVHQSLLNRIRPDESPGFESQPCLLLAAPRGPPLSA